MSITFTIEDNEEYCRENNLVHVEQYDCPRCAGLTPEEDCFVCHGTGKQNVTRLPFELNVANVNGYALLAALDLDECPALGLGVEPTGNCPGDGVLEAIENIRQLIATGKIDLTRKTVTRRGYRGSFFLGRPGPETGRPVSGMPGSNRQRGQTTQHDGLLGMKPVICYSLRLSFYLGWKGESRSAPGIASEDDFIRAAKMHCYAVQGKPYSENRWRLVRIGYVSDREIPSLKPIEEIAESLSLEVSGLTFEIEMRHSKRWPEAELHVWESLNLALRLVGSVLENELGTFILSGQWPMSYMDTLKMATGLATAIRAETCSDTEGRP